MMMINYRGTSTEPEGSILSRRNCLKESSLQPVVDPWQHNFHLVELGKYCIEKEDTRVVELSNPGSGVSGTNEVGRRSGDCLGLSDQKATAPRSVLLSTNHVFTTLVTASLSRDLHQMFHQSSIFKVTSLSQPSGQL